MSTQPILDRFLDRVDYRNIYLLPYNNDAQILATQTRNRWITGRDLIKQNVEHEAHRLQLYSQHLTDIATDYIWNIHSTTCQKEQFINLANNANITNNINQNRNRFMNNSDTIDRISQITTPQMVNSDQESCFFCGASFHDSNSPNL